MRTRVVGLASGHQCQWRTSGSMRVTEAPRPPVNDIPRQERIVALASRPVERHFLGLIDCLGSRKHTAGSSKGRAQVNSDNNLGIDFLAAPP